MCLRRFLNARVHKYNIPATNAYFRIAAHTYAYFVIAPVSAIIADPLGRGNQLGAARSGQISSGRKHRRKHGHKRSMKHHNLSTRTTGALSVLSAALLATPAHGADLPFPFADHRLLLAATCSLLLALALLGHTYLRLRESNRRAVEAERLFKTAIDGIFDGFAIHDANGKPVMRNADDFSCELGETELQLDDGRWVLHRDRTLPDGSKVGMRTDITELKMRELALHDNATRYRDLVERAPVPIFVHRDGVILYANGATAMVLGYTTPSKVVGKNVIELVHEDHRKIAVQAMLDAQASNPASDEARPTTQSDITFMRHDGALVHTQTRVSHVTFDGAPAFESILHDITARQRTERALTQSEQRYRNLFERSPDAILVHDGQHILFANEAAAKMFGAASDTSLFGNRTQDLLPGLANASTGVQTYQFKRLNGETFDAETVTAPTNYHGQHVHQAVIRDVSERKRAKTCAA